MTEICFPLNGSDFKAQVVGYGSRGADHAEDIEIDDLMCLGDDGWMTVPQSDAVFTAMWADPAIARQIEEAAIEDIQERYSASREMARSFRA